uniref:Uncharacterized protein n=1 Tax=Caenorhabditis japonica TaxID=281687 RepID=A0A8R1IQZ8_CAEJA
MKFIPNEVQTEKNVKEECGIFNWKQEDTKSEDVSNERRKPRRNAVVVVRIDYKAYANKYTDTEMHTM